MRSQALEAETLAPLFLAISALQASLPSRFCLDIARRGVFRQVLLVMICGYIRMHGKLGILLVSLVKLGSFYALWCSTFEVILAIA
ncbi:hypothetical protein VNO78_02716 [Psophocarpus tetragonolobus]|uniref:Uncharacterized protein n=1 Tax=Psophocarpus tetragonolobus TaxID=3891 RepID=A0AAN9T2Y8_PSOTE